MIDSLTVSGKVIIAETGKTDSTLIAVLHRSTDDSAVIKERPRYVAKTDRDGKFPSAAASGHFAVVAFKDEGGQRKYMNKSQLFGFADSLVNTTENKTFTLYAYTEKGRRKKKTSQSLRHLLEIVRPSATKAALQFRIKG